jgi:hypothetical protein
MRVVLGVMWLATLVVMLLVHTGCTVLGPGSNHAAAQAECDDGVHPAPDLPPAMVAFGATRGVGSGDTWFFAPVAGVWSSSVQPESGGTS